ncbi:hypothetical protein PSHT_11587 [Puccinia striiformis]|uniref:Uncharacterized protein n=1 Tax=Puccinia striiformis TaxID=27350 RepID=A0A2S4V2B3_9BASI|nr:hypothetical protein PSHT_11587 [Puccinia striiformis]
MDLRAISAGSLSRKGYKNAGTRLVRHHPATTAFQTSQVYPSPIQTPVPEHLQERYRMLVANLSALFLWIAISSSVIAIPTSTVCPSTLMYSLTTFLIVILHHLNHACVISALFKNGDRVMSPRGLKAVKRAESTESTWHVSSNPSQGSTTGHHQPGGIGR